MLRLLRFAVIFSLPVVVFLLSDCKKDLSAGKLSFSTDTLTFDTVFTSLGSTTQYFKIYNTGRTDLTVSNIQLLHLVGNQFHINVNGVNGDRFTNVVVPARDSLYIFVEVTVDPNSSATPFVIIDDVQFMTNSLVQKVHLQAFGQNAHFHYNEEIKGNQHVTWANDLPHVIMGYEQVDCGSTLTINTGCKVYFSGGAVLLVQGHLLAQAAIYDSILFRGVRLEPYYNALPGQWFGIVFLRDTTPGNCSGQGVFDRCIVDESSYGIYAGAGQSTDPTKYVTTLQPKVTMKRTIIRNTQYNAVYGFNANISAENSLFYAAGDNLVKLGLGGVYNFDFCTLYNVGSTYVNHQSETLLLSNFVSSSNATYPNPLTANFTNCVIYGSLDNEISFNNYNDTSNMFNFTNSFSYCCLKGKKDTVALFSAIDTGNLFNIDPGFESPSTGYFMPADSAGYKSPIIDYSSIGLGVTTDLYDNHRPVSLGKPSTPYDIGAVERQPNTH